jgi:hypothetical protein
VPDPPLGVSYMVTAVWPAMGRLRKLLVQVAVGGWKISTWCVAAWGTSWGQMGTLAQVAPPGVAVATRHDGQLAKQGWVLHNGSVVPVHPFGMQSMQMGGVTMPPATITSPFD